MGRKKQTTDLNIFEYSDYRKFLRDYYEDKKAGTPYFSFRYFSKQAGFTSPNYLKLIMDGERNLSSEAIEKFTKAIKLKPAEARFFRLLVLEGQATTSEEREFFARQIVKSKGYKAVHPLGQQLYDYYANWFAIPLRELMARSDFKNDPGWIAHQFIPPITEAQAKEGVNTLITLGLVEEQPDGTFKQKDTSLTAGDAVTDEAVFNYHRFMIRLGAEALGRFKASDREVSSLTMGVSKAVASQLKERIREFQRDIMALVEQDGSVEEVVQLNFQLFPLLKGKGE